MKIYAEPGAASYTLDLSETPLCPEGFVEMSEERPGLNFIATDDGRWVEAQGKDDDTSPAA